MATNTSTTTHKPGTVAGTVRLSACDLRPGMIIRFCGPKSKRSGYVNEATPRPTWPDLHGQAWVDARNAWEQEHALRDTAVILTVRSELRGGTGAKRSRWYVLGFTGGRTTSVSAASRHDVSALSDGSAPIVEPADFVADLVRQEQASQHAAAIASLRAQVERYGRAADEHGLGHVVDSVTENVIDELGPEPALGLTGEATARWWNRLATSIWSQFDGEHGIDLDQPIVREPEPVPTWHTPEPEHEFPIEPAGHEDPRRAAVLASLKATETQSATEIARRAGIPAQDRWQTREILEQLVADGAALHVRLRDGVRGYRRPPAAGQETTVRETGDLRRGRLVWSLQQATRPEPVGMIAGRAHVNPGVAAGLLAQMVQDGAVNQSEGPGRVPLYQLPRTGVILAQDLQPGDVVLTTGPRGYVRRRAIGMVHLDFDHDVVTYEADREGPWRLPLDWPLTVALPRLIPPA